MRIASTERTLNKEKRKKKKIKVMKREALLGASGDSRVEAPCVVSFLRSYGLAYASAYHNC